MPAPQPNPLVDINNARNMPREGHPDMIRDFSRLQAEVNTLSVSNLALAQRIMRMREVLRMANDMLAGLGIGDKSPIRLEIADILSNVAMSHPHKPEERCSLTGNGICDAIRDASADGLICWLEKRGYGWSLDHTGNLIEARIWQWPNVIGRYRPNTVEPLADMLRGAMRTMTRDQLCKTNAERSNG